MSSNAVSYSNGVNLSTAHRYSFSILAAVKGWKNGTYTQSKGLIFKSNAETTTKHATFASYNRSANKPSLSITYSNNNSVTNGVYAISNYNTTSYMRCSSINGGTYTSVQTFSSPPASEANRHAMFKIIYRAQTNDYVIRCMSNNEVIIFASASLGAPASIKLQNVSNYDVPTEKAWKFIARSDGYYNLYCTLNGTTYYLYMTDSGEMDLNIDPSVNGAIWALHKYTGPTFRGWGQIGEWPEHIENGSSATIEAYIYSTNIDENRAFFRATAVDPDVATATRSSTYSAQMTITPKYGGNTKIQIESNDSPSVIGYHYLMSGWDTGNFYIQNEYSSQYLTVLGGTSDSELRLTDLPSGEDKEYTLWKMAYWSQGYYKIIQDINGDCIYGNNPTDSNLEGKPWANDTWQQNLWKFIPQSDGTYKIQSYYHERNNPNNYVSLDDTTTKNIRSLSDTGDKQLWNIRPLKFNVKVLYDQAFIDEHGSNYMNVLNHVFGENSIDNSIEKALFEQLGIRFSLTYVSTESNPFVSYPYDMSCLKCSDRNVFCLNHSSNSGSYTCNDAESSTALSDCENNLHHKRWNIFDDNMPVSTYYIPILFTGHRGCGSDNNNDDLHGLAWVAGYANYVGGSRIVILSQGEVASTGDWSAELLLHEIVHILNVPDNDQDYENPNSEDYDPSQAYRMDCVVGHNYQDEEIQKNLIICEYCKNLIRSYKYSFYDH